MNQIFRLTHINGSIQWTERIETGQLAPASRPPLQRPTCGIEGSFAAGNRSIIFAGTRSCVFYGTVVKVCLGPIATDGGDVQRGVNVTECRTLPKKQSIPLEQVSCHGTDFMSWNRFHVTHTRSTARVFKTDITFSWRLTTEKNRRHYYWTKFNYKHLQNKGAKQTDHVTLLPNSDILTEFMVTLIV